MNQVQKRESIKGIKNLGDSPLSNSSENRHKTSMLIKSPKNIHILSQKRQYDRMKALFRDTATKYYNKQIKTILQEEVKKIKQNIKIQNTIDIIKSPEYIDNTRSRHHQKVTQVSEKVKQLDLQKSINALDRYLKKKQIIDKRVTNYINQKKQQCLNKSLSTQRTHHAHEQQKTSQIIKSQSPNITNIKKQSHLRNKSADDDFRRQKVQLMRQKQQQIKINTFMIKMKGVKDSLAKKQVQKHRVFLQKKNIPVKCLTHLRNNKHQSIRQQIQKQFEQKQKIISSKLEALNHEKQQNIFNNSQLRQSHSRDVFSRYYQTRQEHRQLKLSKHVHSSSTLKKYQNQNMIQMKKEFKLKKEQQQIKNSLMMRKLVDKIRNLKMIDSRSKLPESNINNFKRILNEIVDNPTNTELFQETKYKVAKKIVMQEEAKRKPRKNNN